MTGVEDSCDAQCLKSSTRLLRQAGASVYLYPNLKLLLDGSISEAVKKHGSTTLC